MSFGGGTCGHTNVTDTSRSPQHQGECNSLVDMYRPRLHISPSHSHHHSAQGLLIHGLKCVFCLDLVGGKLGREKCQEQDGGVK